MSTPDPIRAALERLVELDEGCTADHWHAAILAARAALDAAPEGEPSDEELRNLWSWSSGQDQGPWPTQYHCFARAVLARWGRAAAPPAPAAGEVGPSNDDLALVYHDCCGGCELMDQSGFEDAARVVLARWGNHFPDARGMVGPATTPTPAAGEVGEALAARPLLEQVAAIGDCISEQTVGRVRELADRASAWLAENPPGQPVAIEPRGCPMPGACSCVEMPTPQPVAVSERLPGAEDCAPWPGEPNAGCWCWMASCVDNGWAWEQRTLSFLVSFPQDFTHWLPAHALPLPATTPAGQEGE